MSTTFADRVEIERLLRIVDTCLDRGWDVPVWVGETLRRFDYDDVKRQWAQTLDNPDAERQPNGVNVSERTSQAG